MMAALAQCDVTYQHVVGLVGLVGSAYERMGTQEQNTTRNQQEIWQRLKLSPPLWHLHHYLSTVSKLELTTQHCSLTKRLVDNRANLIAFFSSSNHWGDCDFAFCQLWRVERKYEFSTNKYTEVNFRPWHKKHLKLLEMIKHFNEVP